MKTVELRYSKESEVVLFPEQVEQLNTEKQKSITVVYPLDAKLNPVQQYVIINKAIISISDLSYRLELSLLDTYKYCLDNHISLHYVFTDVIYLCRQVYKQEQNRESSNVSLFLPSKVTGKKLTSTDVTQLFTLDLRTELNNRHLDYVKSKLR